MKKLLLLSLTILLFSCGDSDSDEPQPFRDIYKNTYWEHLKNPTDIYTFDNNIIHKIAAPQLDRCWLTTEGSRDDVSNYNESCTWDNVTREIIMERDDIFVYREVYTIEDEGSCYSGEVIHTYKAVGYNEIVWTYEYSDDGDIYTQRLFRLEDGVTPPTYTGCESW